MPLYKAFIKIFLRRLPSIIAYFVIFAVIAFIMGSSGEKQSGFEATKLRVAVFDMDDTESSRALIKFISDNHKLVGGLNDREQTLQDNLYYGIIDYAITIDEGFEGKLNAGEFDGLITTCKSQGSYGTTFLDSQLEQYFKLVSVRISSGDDAPQACIRANALSREHVKVKIAEASGGSTSKFGYFTQYLAYIFICVTIMGVTPCLMRLQAEDLRKRVICSPVPPASRTVQMTLGSFTIIGGIWLAFMMLAASAYGSEMFTRNGLLCILNSLCYIIMAAGITLVVSQFSVSDNVLSMISNVISLGMSFLCGVFVPQQYLGSGVLKAAHALPAYWYIRANDMLCGFSEKPFSMSLYITCTGVQLGFAAALFIAAGVISAKKKR